MAPVLAPQVKVTPDGWLTAPLIGLVLLKSPKEANVENDHQELLLLLEYVVPFAFTARTCQ